MKFSLAKYFSHVPTLLLAVGLCFLLCSNSRANEAIEVSNPGFEETLGGEFVGWQFLTDPAHTESAQGVATKAALAIDAENAQSGKNAALILHEGPRWATIRQPLALLPGGTYRLTVHVRSESGASQEVRGNVRLTARIKKEEFVKPVDGEPGGPFDIKTSGQWEKITRDFKVSDTLPTKRKVVLELRAIPRDEEVSNPIKVWFDSVTVERLE